MEQILLQPGTGHLPIRMSMYNSRMSCHYVPPGSITILHREDCNSKQYRHPKMQLNQHGYTTTAMEVIAGHNDSKSSYLGSWMTSSFWPSVYSAELYSVKCCIMTDISSIGVRGGRALPENLALLLQLSRSCVNPQSQVNFRLLARYTLSASTFGGELMVS